MLAIVLATSCAVTQGPSPYRRDDGVTSRVDDFEQPGGLFTIVPARRHTVTCPACGALNTLGASQCVACEGRLSTRPVWKACAACEGSGKGPTGPCKECGGRGFVQAVETGASLEK